MLRFDRVTNASNYSVQTAPEATGPWADEDISTATRVVIGGLTPGETLSRRVFFCRAALW